jgi:hypothetical protein
MIKRDKKWTNTDVKYGIILTAATRDLTLVKNEILERCDEKKE